MFATSKTQWRRPLVTIPITFSRHTRPALSPCLPSSSCSSSSPTDQPSLTTSAIRSIDRRRRIDGGDIACLLAPEKSLILGIPCEDSTGRVTRSEIAVTITGFRENERGRSPVGQDQSFSNPPDRMLYPRGDSSVGTAGVGEGGEAGGERVLRKAKEGERRKGSLIRSRGEPGPRFLRDSFASRRLAGI